MKASIATRRRIAGYIKRLKIPAEECSRLKMVAGNEEQFSVIIDGDEVKEWVGIGWITIRTAKTEDRKKIPTVTREGDQ